jgi:DNA-binding transcriptional regulator YhcF (GntR family)
MKIQPVAHHTLAEAVAGRLVASLLDGTWKAGDQLPAERDLIEQLDVSRATLREALKALAEGELIEARPGVGWFARAIGQSNMAQAREMAQRARAATAVGPRAASEAAPEGPRRLPASPEKPLHVPNLNTDRLGTFELISWWEREKVRAAWRWWWARAPGQRGAKNLVSMGGSSVRDRLDTITGQLSRSVLMRRRTAQGGGCSARAQPRDSRAVPTAT